MYSKQDKPAIICFSGPPGVGKTSLVQSIARALDRKYVKISLGGINDEAEIRGHRRTYVGAIPGKIIDALKKAGVNNPVFLLDEIDKIGKDYKGDPAAALLEVLDPEQNRLFTDHYIEEPFDLSKVMFIATANDIYKIPRPLLDRMELIQLSSYTEIEKMHIAIEHLIPKTIRELGIKKDLFIISDEAIKKIIISYTSEAGVRQLERLISSIARKIILKKMQKASTKLPVHVDLTNLEEYLGKEKYFNSIANKQPQIGVVTGLAYTEAGGDILPIEVNTFKGKGQLILTGNLGDVMKESAQISLDYIKSNASSFNIDVDFNTLDIHVHVPEGAIPKDGPSAGVTITTALISVLTQKPVRADIAMTGEITLVGKVLPIGGLKEKSISAHRSGIKKIFIPKENARDLDDIPEEVKNSLEIVLTDDIHTILEGSLL